MLWVAIWIYLALQPGSSEPNRLDALVEGIRQTAPHIDEAKALAHAEAASLVGDAAGIEPELLLAMAYVESRFDPSAISKPRGARGQWFCGVLQVGAQRDRLACSLMGYIGPGYVAGAVLLRRWLRAARGNLRDALNGYGCGFAGFEHGCRRYAERVLHVKRRLHRAARDTF